MDKKTDNVNHPAHYADHYPHEVIELTECLGFCLGNAVKYILRAPFKGKEMEDLQKAAWYLKRLVNDGENRPQCEFLIGEDGIEPLLEFAKSYGNTLLDMLLEAAWNNDIEEMVSVIGVLELDVEDLKAAEKAKEKRAKEDAEKREADLVYICSRITYRGSF